MHDPMHVLWEIRLPFPIGAPRWRRLSLLTIWHLDPCVGGKDDSCSTRHRLGRKHRQLIECLAGDEARRPWFQREQSKEPRSPADAEALLRGALWLAAVAFRLHRWGWGHRKVTFAECSQLACALVHDPVDNVRSSLCLLPGYHTNTLECSLEQRQELATAFYFTVARVLSRHTARWWQRPGFHFWHWRFQFNLWQTFARRFIERCSVCRQKYRGRSDVFSAFGGGATWCGECQGVGQKPKSAAKEAKP